MSLYKTDITRAAEPSKVSSYGLLALLLFLIILGSMAASCSSDVTAPKTAETNLHMDLSATIYSYMINVSVAHVWEGNSIPGNEGFTFQYWKESLQPQKFAEVTSQSHSHYIGSNLMMSVTPDDTTTVTWTLIPTNGETLLPAEITPGLVVQMVWLDADYRIAGDFYRKFIPATRLSVNTYQAKFAISGSKAGKQQPYAFTVAGGFVGMCKAVGERHLIMNRVSYKFTDSNRDFDETGPVDYGLKCLGDLPQFSTARATLSSSGSVAANSLPTFYDGQRFVRRSF